MKTYIILISFLFSLSSIIAQNVVGTWSGTLDLGSSKLRLVVNIHKEGESYSGSMDSPDQGATGIPISKIIYNGKLLSFDIEALNVRYEGAILGDSIEGIFTQMGQSFPLIFEKKEVIVNRPQNPARPYNYFSEDITFYNNQASINLAGTFTYPRSGSNFPVAILISGSGPQNRDEEILGHKPFWVLSDYLTNNGIAVLRFDDRGVGESEGSFAKSTTSDFATDVFAAVEYLKSRSEIDRNTIGLIGHSEGGIIAFKLASQYPKDISFIISMAGPGVSGKEVLRLQSKDTLLFGGASDSIATENQQLALKIIEYIEKHDNAYIKKNIEQILRDILSQDMQTVEIMRTVSNEIARMSSPWFREFISYDPASDMRKIKANVFAINGEKDFQVNAAVNLKVIDANLLMAKSKKIKKYPNLNHLFQTANTGALSEYSAIEETISPEVLEDIANWINGLYN